MQEKCLFASFLPQKYCPLGSSCLEVLPSLSPSPLQKEITNVTMATVAQLLISLPTLQASTALPLLCTAHSIAPGDWLDWPTQLQHRDCSFPYSPPAIVRASQKGGHIPGPCQLLAAQLGGRACTQAIPTHHPIVLAATSAEKCSTTEKCS